MPVYYLTIFLGSFLLFQIQPLAGKYILPWFGGSPAVWTTCMLFFQFMLLAGYCYAHLVTFLGRRQQGYLHSVLLITAILFLPITPSPDVWKLSTGDGPVIRILLLLLGTIGMPYFLLSATSPLVAHWFVRAFPGRSPYRLYALSNFGSLLALCSYPIVVEPAFGRAQQLRIWEWGFAAFLFCCAWCGLSPLFGRRDEKEEMLSSIVHTAELKEGLAVPDMVIWLGLSACGSTMLLATTNQLCQDVAVVPLLWVIPLAIYLLTFILCFNSDRINNRIFWGITLAVATIAVYSVLLLPPHSGLWLQISVYITALFACCMACHGELARSRPHPEHLTGYYLIISTGGALGGLFVSLLAPLVFKDYWEYPLALTGSCLIVILAWQRSGSIARTSSRLQRMAVAAQVALVLFTGYYLFSGGSPTLFKDRNFFGVLRVLWQEDKVGKRMTLSHGRTTHGWQYTDQDRSAWPTSYYGADSGVGLALRFHPHRFAASPSQQNLRVGVIGLGVGTVAAYGRQGDYFRFYEINPAVIWLADNLYSYRRNSPAKVDIVEGDARILMETELKQNQPQEFDVLIVDAFSSDAIPVHLLTRECFAVYRQHLKQDGLLLVHITNDFLNLYPVVRDQGKNAGFPATRYFDSPENERLGVAETAWVLLAMNDEFANRREVAAKVSRPTGPDIELKPWTDDFVSIWQLIY